MRIEAKFVGDNARQSAEMLPPFGPGFERGIVNQIATLEVHVSDFRDPGPDYCEWQGFDARGERIATARIRGY